MCDWARASRNGLHGSCEVDLLFSKPLCVKKVAPFLRLIASEPILVQAFCKMPGHFVKYLYTCIYLGITHY